MYIRYISSQTGEPDQGLRHPEAVGLYMKPLQETGASTELSITAATNVELSQRVDLKSPCPPILTPGPSTNTTPHTPPPEGLNQALRSSKQAVYTLRDRGFQTAPLQATNVRHDHAPPGPQISSHGPQRPTPQKLISVPAHSSGSANQGPFPELIPSQHPPPV